MPINDKYPKVTYNLYWLDCNNIERLVFEDIPIYCFHEYEELPKFIIKMINEFLK